MNGNNSALSIAETGTNRDALTYLPLDHVEPKPGFNSRTFFDEESLQELSDSIRQQGVVQPIVVRPNIDRGEGYYYITAGERRWRAACKASLTDIPCLVRCQSDSEAMIVNAIENKDREDIGPAEEAVLVRRVLDSCNGDRDETAKLLGYSRTTVDARLLLLNATDAVREALTTRKIKLGHAELLSTLPSGTQDGTLAKVFENQTSVQELREKLAHYTLRLDTAIFDTSACRDCQRNSSVQASLFSQHVGEGRCSDHECYCVKRDATLAEKKAELLKTYPVVFTDKEKDPSSYTLLVKQGPQGVGKPQFSACLACASFGGLMSTRPGEEGQVTSDVCFDLTCNREKVKAYQSSLTPTTATPKSESEKNSTGTGNTTKTGPAKTPSKTTASANATPKKIEALVHGFWRNTAAKTVVEHPRMALALAIYTLAEEAGSAGDKVLKQFELKSSDFRNGTLAKALDKLSSLDGEKLKSLLTELASVYLGEALDNSYGKDMPEIVAGARSVLRATGIDLSKHFVLSKDYLESHTKSGIESLMAECGFDEWYGENKKDPKAFTRLMTEKHEVIVRDVIKSGFDFTGFVPKAVQIA